MPEGSGVYWGDLHNHNEIGYGKGSLGRAIDIAGEHLDFFAFTPHGQWFDEENTGPQVHEKHRRGFQMVRERWPEVRRAIEAAYRPGRFVTFLAHEWHSSGFGDYHIVYPGPDHDIAYFDNIHRLQDHVRRAGAIMVPHHCAYALGSRGTNWDYVDTEVSPVAEVFSEHGSSESEWGPWPMTGHSMGPASTTQTVGHALERGLVLGFTASSDDHAGFPGAYGEGLTAVFAETLTREAVFAAIRDRRTYAVTGERIGLGFSIDQAPMGSVIADGARRRIEVRVEGEDRLRAVELVKNGRVFRDLLCLPRPRPEPADAAGPVRARLRVEWGWGGMEEAGTTDWSLRLALSEGEILSVTPHFQSGPFDEERRHRVTTDDGRACHWQSYTARRGAFRGVPTNSLVLTLVASPRAIVTVEAEQPAAGRLRLPLAGLLSANHVERMGETFTAPTLLLHRALPVADTTFVCAIEDREREREQDYYYLRVLQDNGQMAWSSPIWVGG